MTRKDRVAHLLGYRIRIRIVKRVPGKAWADYDHATDCVRIDKEASVENRVSSLLHELLHGAREKLGLLKYFKGQTEERRLENEENYVIGLEPAIISMLRDNGVDLSPLEDLVR